MAVQLNRSAMEDYIEYLIIIKRFDDAAVKLVEIINDDKYVSAKGKSKHEVGHHLVDSLLVVHRLQLWMELSELIRKNATAIVSINVCANFGVMLVLCVFLWWSGKLTRAGGRHSAQWHPQVHGYGGQAVEFARRLLHPSRKL
jgi:hypothetical protein